MEDMGHWQSPTTTVPATALGFLYLIENKRDGRYYYGIKQFYTGKSRKKTPWKKYTSSSKPLQEEIARSKNDWDFLIVSYHDSKSALKIAEAIEILKHYQDPRNLNGIINLRINLKHFKKEKK